MFFTFSYIEADASRGVTFKQDGGFNMKTEWVQGEGWGGWHICKAVIILIDYEMESQLGLGLDSRY